MAHQLCTFKFLWNTLLQNCVEPFSIVLCVLLLRKEIVRSGANLNTHTKFHAFNTIVDIWKECWIFSRTTRIMDFKILIQFFFRYTIIIFNWVFIFFALKTSAIFISKRFGRSELASVNISQCFGVSWSFSEAYRTERKPGHCGLIEDNASQEWNTTPWNVHIPAEAYSKKKVQMTIGWSCGCTLYAQICTDMDGKKSISHVRLMISDHIKCKYISWYGHTHICSYLFILYISVYIMFIFCSYKKFFPLRSGYLNI